VASVKLVASNESRPQTTEKKPTDQPIKEEPVNPPPQVEPALTRPKPTDIPRTPPEVKKEIVKKPDPSKPIAKTEPKPQNVEAPKLETITKVAEVLSKASPASLQMEGAVDDLPQKLAINPPPPYPAEAVAARQEGTVTLRVTISAEGRVAAISLYSSSGVQSLDDSALATVRRWVFSPARRSGRAVAFEVLVPVEFSIRRSF